MDTRTMIKELERVEEKHKHDKVFIGQLNVAEMAHDVRKRLEELKPYEDIGLTPGQIREIDRLYAEKCQEVAELRQRNTAKEPQYEGDSYHEGGLVYDTWICPNCGKRYEVDYDDYDFCPKCGQKILWREAGVQESEQILEKLSAYICDELCCHRNVGADKGDYEMQEICERCELGGYLDEIRKCLSGASNSEIVRARAMSEAVRQGIIDGMSNPLQINGIQEWKERMLQNFMRKSER